MKHIFCPRCRKATKHDTLVENRLAFQRIHDVCLECNHSNGYMERSRSEGYPVIKKISRDEKTGDLNMNFSNECQYCRNKTPHENHLFDYDVSRQNKIVSFIKTLG